MKILLVQPPWYGFQNLVSNRLYLGLAYLGAVLEKDAHEILILNGEIFFNTFKEKKEEITIDEAEYLKNLSPDHYVYKKIIEKIKDWNPDAVGISFMTAAASSAYTLSRLIKNYKSDMPLIAGGWHPTILPEEAIKKGLFDYAVRGEGEETIAELIRAIEQKQEAKDILGISYKVNNEIRHNPNRPFIKDLDSIPLPAFQLLHDYENQKASCTGIVTSRGCPFSCTYCASKVMWTQKVRFRSADNVVDEIKYRYEKLGIRSFSFNDDTFTFNANRVKEICNKIIKLGLKIRWQCDTRGDTLDLEILKLMKKAGCDHIYLGLETGSPKILKQIKKYIDIATVKKAVNLARRADIETTVYFMVGFPNETKDDIEMSIDAMKDIKPDNAIWSILTLYPGTEIWNLALSQGLVTIDQDWNKSFHHYNQGNIFNSISKESWNEMLKIIYFEQKKLHNRITEIKIRKKIKALPKMIKLGLKKPSRILPYFINLIKR